MADHKHGTMDTRVHEKTFEGFISVATRSLIAILVIVVLMALLGA